MIPKNPEALTAIAEAQGADVKQLLPIHFEFNDPAAVTVHVAGSFNGWSPQATPLTRSYGGRWENSTTLEPGNYEYCLVVDGRWILDPRNQVSVDNPYGGRNSVLIVVASKAAAHLIEAEHQPFLISAKSGPVGTLSSDGRVTDPMPPSKF